MIWGSFWHPGLGFDNEMNGQRWGSRCVVTTGVYGMRVISCRASVFATRFTVVKPAGTFIPIDLPSVTNLVLVATARGGSELVRGSSGLVGVISIGGGRAAFR